MTTHDFLDEQGAREGEALETVQRALVALALCKLTPGEEVTIRAAYGLERAPELEDVRSVGEPAELIAKMRARLKD